MNRLSYSASGSPVGRSVRPVRADQERVAREDPVLQPQTHRIARVAGRVHRGQPQVADREDVAVVEPHIRERRRTVAMHDDRYAGRPAEVVRRREMVGVRMRVDHVTDPQSVTSRVRVIAVELADLRVDQDGCTGRLTADQVGLTATGCDLLEQHGGCRVRDCGSGPTP